MTDENKTSILCILDRSGSMSSIKDDAIGGFNEFIKKQKEEPGEANVTTILFDDQYEVLYKNKNLQDVPVLTEEEFFPRGTTALYDSMGKGMSVLGEELSKLKEEERPGTVIVVVTTDGYENASTEYSRAQIQEMIKTQKDVYSWKFMFLCANEDTLKDGIDLGFSKNLSFKFDADSIGSRSSAAVYSCAVSELRSCKPEHLINTQSMYDDIDSESRTN